MTRAVIFDFDGVVVNSEHVNRKAAEAAFREFEITLDKKDKKLIVGRHPIDYYDTLSKKYSFNHEEVMQRQIKHFVRLYADNAKPYERTIKLAQNLKERGMKLAVATSSIREVIDATLKKFRLNNIFDVIVAFEDCDQRKPAPDPYLLAARKLEISPVGCLVLEDTAIGVQSAKAAGMKCVALPNKYTIGQDLSGADIIINPEEKSLDKVLFLL